jgi:hypothetical protein
MCERFLTLPQKLLRRDYIMDYQDFLEMGHKARPETEDFINHHIHDQRKRWPLTSPPARISQDAV